MNISRPLRTRKTALALAATLALGMAPAQHSLAAACTFNPASGNWNVAGNWSCGLIPSGPAADSATVGAGSTVTVDDARSIFNFSNAGALNIDASTFSLQSGGSTTNTGAIHVGGASTAALQMSHSINNAGGTINIANGSVLNQFVGNISGGTINTTGSGAVVAFSNVNNSLADLTLNGRLDVTGGNTHVRLSKLTLNGNADVGSTDTVYLNAIGGASSIGGNATFNLSAGSRLNVEGVADQTLGATVLVRGAGQLGQATQLSGNTATTLINNGRISADVGGGTLTVVPIANFGVLTNNNVLEARNGGTLQLATSVVQGAAGRITAENGSVVLLNVAGVNGGALGTAGSGVLRSTNNAINALSGLTLGGTVDLASAASQLRLTGGITLGNAAIDIGSSSVVYLDNRSITTQSIGGSGTFTLGGGALRMEGTGQTTTGANVTIRGSGTVGQATLLSGQYTWISNGLVSADVAGQTLQLAQPGNGSTAIQTNGIFEATGGGRLLLSADIDASPASQFRTGAGSTIEMNGVRVTGTVNTSGAGRFVASNNVNNLLSGVALNGTLDMASQASQLRIGGGLTLNGLIGVGSGSALYLDNRSTATQSITGSGTIQIAGGALRMEGTGQTTTGANIAIRGSGTVGQATVQSGQYAWINNGLVSADVAGQTLQLVQPGNGSIAIRNNGMLEATGGGRLLLSADVDASPTSQLRTGAGSTIEMNGVRLTGTVNTSGAGSFRTSNSFNNLLSGVSLNGNLDMASQASQLRISDNLALNGTINVGAVSAIYLDNRASPTQSLTGTGTIQISGGSMRFEGAGQTTLGSGITVQGAGTLGPAVAQTGNHLLVNDGTVSAHTSGQTLNIVPIGNGALAIQNNSTLQAAGGGQLVLGSNVDGGAGSRLDVAAGSQILMNGVTLSGVVNQTGSGAIDVSSSFNNAIKGSTLSGRMNVGTSAASQLRITDGMTMSGGATITVGNAGALYFDNRSAADQTIGGSGQIVLNNGLLRFEGGNSTTWGSGISVRGSGTIGPAVNQTANHTLFNNGTVVADGGTLTIAPIANVGALQGTGTLRIDGGVLTLSTGQTTRQGTLDIRGTGTLAMGTQNLVLSSDYTNAQAGSGNSFNRRAGVSGSGLIQAAGDVAQVISGSGMTNGNTGNATLTIGNVRVGSTTFNYQVGNGGTNGPTLRGAIQTSVNGANLTDARLSGSGVTAANYNAGAPGGSSGNLAVTFSAASAGALAALSGQVLNLRSNFDNIADQKLNIVLGNNAAAYNAALGHALNPVTVANQRVGGSNTAPVSITNAAAAGAFSEDLNARVSSVGGSATASGTLSGRVAGTSNTGTGGINVGVATGTAGAKTGTLIVAYETAGTVGGVSNGLGTASAGTQAVTVNGNVYQQAAGQIVSAPLNFGTVQVGQVVSRDLQVRNTASGPAGFVEDLNASFGAKSGAGTTLFSGAGSLSGITAGSTSSGGNGTMTVSVNTAAAGTVAGSIAVNYTSAGAVGGVSNGLGTLAVGSESYGVAGTIQAQANVINQASPLLNNPVINLGAVRVGAASPTALVSITNQATAAPQAALNASISSNGAPITASGSFNLLAPGASSTALQVGLSTAVAGNFTGGNAGSATVGLVSDAANVGNCAPDCQLTLVSQTVTVAGKVYTPAVGQSNTPVVDFGIVRVGDTVSARNITVSNTAAVTALNDTLRASVGGLSGPFTAGSAAATIAAQDSGQIAVGLNTTAAGVFSQNGNVSFLSQNPDMADAAAGPSAGVQVQAQVNNLANADFDLLSGLGQLSDLGNGTFVLDLGSIALGSSGNWMLQIDNDVGGPADALRGLFDLAAADDFLLGGFGVVAGLEAGQAQGGLAIDFSATQLGSFQDEVAFHGFSYNASDPNGLTQDRRLLIRASVFDPNGGGGSVPEPGTLALLVLAALAARRAARTAASTATRH